MNVLPEIAILSDVHGNSVALQAVLDDIDRHCCNKIYLLGDIPNGLDGPGCRRLLQNRIVTCLKGNAEYSILTGQLEALLHLGDSHIAEMAELFLWFQNQSSPEDLAWLSTFADYLLEGPICMVHDHPLERLYPFLRNRPDIPPLYQEFYFHSVGIYPDKHPRKLEELVAWMKLSRVCEVYVGHTHIPWIIRDGQYTVCNAGSVGMPLDGDPRACWIQAKAGPAGRREVLLHRVEYDIDRAIALVDQSIGYPRFEHQPTREAYKTMFRTGKHWKDILAAG